LRISVKTRFVESITYEEPGLAISRTQARSEHAAQAGAGHDQFSETIYGVICSACHNYILIDKTNCPSSCREHEACRQAYS
jgi:cytochrome c5